MLERKQNECILMAIIERKCLMVNVFLIVKKSNARAKPRAKQNVVYQLKRNDRVKNNDVS